MSGGSVVVEVAEAIPVATVVHSSHRTRRTTRMLPVAVAVDQASSPGIPRFRRDHRNHRDSRNHFVGVGLSVCFACTVFIFCAAVGFVLAMVVATQMTAATMSNSTESFAPTSAPTYSLPSR